MNVSRLSEEEKEEILTSIQQLTEDGYRVLGVGASTFPGHNFPEEQQQFQFLFKGLLAFYDPPKQNIADVFKAFYKAGIMVKIITGDNAATTKAIARQVGFKESENYLLGEELVKLSDAELQ
jgi:Ca2+-transporting ATPase